MVIKKMEDYSEVDGIKEFSKKYIINDIH